MTTPNQTYGEVCDDGGWLTIGEAMRLLGVTRSQLEAMWRRDEIRFYRLFPRSHRRVPRRDVERLIALSYFGAVIGE